MDVKGNYLSLLDASAVLIDAARTWDGSDYCKIAHGEGWNIFNLTPSGNWTDAGIECYDDPIEAGCQQDLIDFDSDEAVIAHLQAGAADNPTYAKALRIEHALNSLRFHVWGPEWVDSRIGPSI